jgi:hypothetical protein
MADKCPATFMAGMWKQKCHFLKIKITINCFVDPAAIRLVEWTVAMRAARTSTKAATPQ